MAPLNTEARRDGHKAMESSLNAAARVRRGLKAGAPRKLSPAPVPVLEAFGQLSRQADRARELMVKENLDPNDIMLCLCFYRPDMETRARFERLPTPDKLGSFFTKLEGIAAESPVDYLGILWIQNDREAGPEEPKANIWVTQFRGGSDAVAMLSELRDFIDAAKNPN